MSTAPRQAADLAAPAALARAQAALRPPEQPTPLRPRAAQPAPAPEIAPAAPPTSSPPLTAGPAAKPRPQAKAAAPQTRPAAPQSTADGALANEQAERSILGSILLDNGAFQEARENGLAADYFSLDSHRRIWRCMGELMKAKRAVDIVTLSDALDRHREIAGVGGRAYLFSLTENLPRRPVIGEYIALVKEKARARRLLSLAEATTARIAAGEGPDEVTAWALESFQSINAGALPWRDLFHSIEEFENAPPVNFAINGFLQEAGITLFGGLAGCGKTMLMISVAQALLNGMPLFDCFPVPRTSNKVLYLIPESSLGPFVARLHLFRLEDHVRAGRLLFRTLSSREDVALTDPRILQAVEGADVFLDTAVRFMNGAENDAETSRAFAQTLFALLCAGARTICGAHHSPKSSETQERMTLENMLRGSGDIGAMISTAWGLRQIDADANRIYIENVKARDFAPPEPFIIQGRPSLDREGHFQLVAKPGEAGELRDHLNRKQEKKQLAIEMHASGKSVREIAAALQVSKSTVSRWLPDAGAEMGAP
jgi:hypothetical protein